MSVLDKSGRIQGLKKEAERIRGEGALSEEEEPSMDDLWEEESTGKGPIVRDM